MTDDELKEIEQRANAATPGPWQASPKFHPKEIHFKFEGKPALIAEFFANCKNAGDTEENVVFSAHARTDIPALLEWAQRLKAWWHGADEAHRRAEAENDKLREALTKIANNTVPGGHDQAIARAALEEK